MRRITEDSKLETDYLVVGAGALGMAFVDALLAHGDADVVMVERRHRPGGHWLDAYPFVQLHQPSRYYGVDSTPLGRDRIELDGMDAGFYERATGTEICGYFDDVMRHRFEASGRVRFFPMCDYQGEGRFRSRVTGQVTHVEVRSRVIDATYMASRVPATDPPPFAVADGVRWIPLGELTALDAPPPGFVIVGGGKTALDAIGWLLERGQDPDTITWVRPQDSWLLNRAFYQPDQVRTLEGTVLQLEAMGASSSVDDVYERLEAQGLVLRTDPSVVPTMMRGATLSVGELEQLRQVRDVVRLGHVERIEADRIVLEHGAVPVDPGRVHVHCAAPGLGDNPPRPIFTDDTVTLQLVTRLSLTLSGALQGVLEGSGRTTDEKNRLCPPTTMPHTPFDYLRVVLAGISTEMGWPDAPDLQQFVDQSRLNLISGVGVDGDPALVGPLLARFFAALPDAFEQLAVFASQVTPRERERMFVVAS